MSISPLENVLCRYFYDPLDRQTDCTLHQQPAIQRFNCKDQLATEIQGNARRSILQCDNQLLAQLNDLDAKLSTTLLATDQQRSVLNALDANQPNPFAYSPYGHRPAESGLLSLLGFNGERPDPVTGHYHLGNGYRQFNPVLMRFNSPDSWSPFGDGGVNAYAYCQGDPANKADPDGHSSLAFALGVLMTVAGITMIVIGNKKKSDALAWGGFAVLTAGVFFGVTGLAGGMIGHSPINRTSRFSRTTSSFGITTSSAWSSTRRTSLTNINHSPDSNGAPSFMIGNSQAKAVTPTKVQTGVSHHAKNSSIDFDQLKRVTNTDISVFSKKPRPLAPERNTRAEIHDSTISTSAVIRSS